MKLKDRAISSQAKRTLASKGATHRRPLLERSDMGCLEME